MSISDDDRRREEDPFTSRWTTVAPNRIIPQRSRFEVDLNRALGRAKGVVAYAYAEFPAAGAREVELRLATVNSWKVWVNGELVGFREEYHHGTRIDHYRAAASLRPGANRILLKVCQNEQTEDYADPWRFQIRVTDRIGTAVLPAAKEAAGGAEHARKEG